VVILLDNAPGHAGEPIQQALAEHAQLALQRLPGYSPQRHVIECFGNLRRATHNRLFDTVADRKCSLRAPRPVLQSSVDDFRRNAQA
jgi:hypothetical protein